MSIEERLHEIQRAINQARKWLDCTEALVKQLVKTERPILELLAADAQHQAEEPATWPPPCAAS
jgi:hypothetical protein